MAAKLTKHDFAWWGEAKKVFQYDVRGYPFGEGGAIAQMPHENWTVTNAKAQTNWMGDYATADEALLALQICFAEGDSSMISKNGVEGSLDICWMNFECSTETPVYFLHFLRNQGKEGAQKHKEIVGKEALETYLRQLGFPWLRIYSIFNEVATQCAVNLPKVMINEYEYAMAYRN